MSRAFHKFWLKITAFVIGSFGPVCFLGTMNPTSAPARLTLDVLRWRAFGTTGYASADTRLLSALLGGFLLGWGVSIWCLSSWVYDQAPEGVRRSVLTGLIAGSAWTAPDPSPPAIRRTPSSTFLSCC